MYMKRFRAFLLPLFLLSIMMPGSAAAQIYSGLQAMKYASPHNGTPYWSPQAYEHGVLRYNGNDYPDAVLAIDAYLQRLQIRDPRNGLAYVLDPEKVEYLSLYGGEFRHFSKGSALPEGWYQIMHEGDWALYKHVEKRFERLTTFLSRPDSRSLGYDDPNYNENVFDYFSIVVTYWHIASDGKVRHFSRQRKAERLLQKAEPAAEAPRQASIEAGSPAKAPSRPMFASGWFDDRSKAAASKMLDTTHTQVTYQNKIYEIGTAASGRTRAVVSGLVTDLKKGTPIEGIAVYDSTRTHWSTTGADGRYSLTLPTGHHILHFGGNIGWQDSDIEIVLNGTGELDIALNENLIDLEGAHISAESMQQHRNSFIGIEKIQLDRIRHIPVAFGEADVIKAILTMPGVQSVGEASSGFNVRGGSVDQNLILFNGGTVYNPSHMFGIFSSFNSDVVREAELYKSSIPAEFGGRISSVLDISSREGNTERVKGDLGIGLLTSHACIDGPLGNENTTFILSGRTTYSNWLLDLIPEQSHYHGGKASFYDINAGITHRFSDNDKLSLSGYYSRDHFAFGEGLSFRYGNLNIATCWQHRDDDGGSMEFRAGYDRYANETEDTMEGYLEDFGLRTDINQGFAKMKFTRRIDGHNTLTYGGNAIYYVLQPGHMFPTEAESMIADRQLPVQNAVEPSVFISDTWEPDSRFSLDGGLRLGAFWSLTANAFYAMPEARIAARYSIKDNLTVKAGINTMRQNIHLITNTSSISPMDTWTLVTDRIKPQDGFQAATGLYWTIGKQSIDLSVEAYYKQSWRNLDYISGASLAMNENLADDLLEVSGRSYGIEFMARKATGALNGWISYVYSRSWYKEMHDNGIYSINNGASYRSPHDKPHNLKFVGNYAFTHRYSLSVNMDWSTGRPVSIPVGLYTYGGKTRLAYSSRNGHRIPDYFRLDLAFNIEPGHYLKKLTHMSFSLGCYNVTGRKNAYSVYYTVQGYGAVGNMLSVFATQIPYLTLNLKF